MPMNALDVIRFDLQEAAEGLNRLIGSPEVLENISRAADLIVETQKAGGKVLSCGNGGSLCDAMHFAEEMTGRFRNDRPPYAAIAISDPSHMACVGNDYGYEAVFSRYVEGVAKKGDVLLAISTSGTSRNILAAVRAAKAQGVKVIGLTGRHDSPLEELADVAVVTPAGRYADRVQELHIKVIHILIELTERQLNPENYPDPE
ncbi:MAG: D-sedoheptulose 7-phosphate isomerase [Mesosutterella sp.]|jgi:D-sedoheptulose 7-phosphate isomerase|uniref:D-sedoheptulose 7-phosphate isomerase n=1 Tax=Mesosutterella multiformis TaxID=2259133 RepID=UPI003E8025DB|nr:D-sedoheptulose 7-phosphate isomerase [Mesosutterella sp.]MCH3937066.1 D-sedoheptulose 7-phosphate isomerase [Mesosutterella sp.]